MAKTQPKKNERESTQNLISGKNYVRLVELGRHAGLRCLCPKGCAGSTPASDISATSPTAEASDLSPDQSGFESLVAHCRETLESHDHPTLQWGCGVTRFISTLSRCGWNGRLRGFKNPGLKRRVGSTPTIGTMRQGSRLKVCFEARLKVHENGDWTKACLRVSCNCSKKLHNVLGQCRRVLRWVRLPHGPLMGHPRRDKGSTP